MLGLWTYCFEYSRMSDSVYLGKTSILHAEWINLNESSHEFQIFTRVAFQSRRKACFAWDLFMLEVHLQKRFIQHCARGLNRWFAFFSFSFPTFLFQFLLPRFEPLLDWWWYLFVQKSTFKPKQFSNISLFRSALRSRKLNIPPWRSWDESNKPEFLFISFAASPPFTIKRLPWS